MSTETDPNRYDGSVLIPLMPTPDTTSVSTDKTRTNPPKNGRVTKEFLVKFEFNATDNNKAVPILQHHRQIMSSILSAHKENCILFDKNDQPIDQARINTIQSNADHAELFDIHSRPPTTTRKTRHLIIMTIRTNLSLSDIKNTVMVMHHMRDKNIFIRMHHFPATVHDVNSLGWFRDLHPTQMSHVNIRKFIDDAIHATSGDQTVIPYYNLAFCNPGFADENKVLMKTKSLEIQVDRKSGRTLDQLLKKAFLSNPIYIPWRTKYQNPDRYRLSLRAQFKYLQNTWTLPVSGVNRYEMAFFAPLIMQTKLISSIQTCRTTDSIGRWNLLCNKAEFNQASDAVTKLINDYANTVPLSPSRATWNYPRKVGQQVRMTSKDESSAGDNSYADASIASLNSLLTLEDRSVVVTSATTSFDLSAMEPPTSHQPSSFLNTMVDSTPPVPAAGFSGGRTYATATQSGYGDVRST